MSKVLPIRCTFLYIKKEHSNVGTYYDTDIQLQHSNRVKHILTYPKLDVLDLCKTS